MNYKISRMFYWFLCVVSLCGYFLVSNMAYDDDVEAANSGKAEVYRGLENE